MHTAMHTHKPWTLDLGHAAIFWLCGPHAMGGGGLSRFGTVGAMGDDGIGPVVY